MFKKSDIKEFSADEIREMRVMVIPCCGRCSNIDSSFDDSCRATNQFVHGRDEIDKDCPYPKLKDVINIYLNKRLGMNLHAQ